MYKKGKNEAVTCLVTVTHLISNIHVPHSLCLFVLTLVHSFMEFLVVTYVVLLNEQKISDVKSAKN